MLELNVNNKSPAAIMYALNQVKKMIMAGEVEKSTPIHLILAPGVYQEVVTYNLPNPLIMESIPGTSPKKCVVQAENCEAFHKGLENRSVFVLGPNTTSVTLKNFSIINTHVKKITEGNTLQDSAEALVWNNTTGTLHAQNLYIEGKQNTLCIKGFSWFQECTICGDTDFIYGDNDTALFEDCNIILLEDNRGDFAGYAIKSTSLANKPGFIFMNCLFTGDKRKKMPMYVCRTEGHGGPAMLKWWDSIALIKCTISDVFDDELVWDDDMNLNIYPRGNARTGIREYRTLTLRKTDKTEEANTALRNVKTYTLTDDDFIQNYASRFLIFCGTPLEKLVD